MHEGYSADETLTEFEKRRAYKPEFVDACISKAHIVEFHPNRSFPYETLVCMDDGDVYVVQEEFEEFIKLYEK